MQSNTKMPFLQSDVSIILDGVKATLAKFPRIRSPIARARLLGTSPGPITPKIYYRSAVGYESYQDRAKRVKRELLDVGATMYGLLKSETRILPKMLHPHEHIEAVIYGQHNSSSAMLAATNERIIYIDKKPMALLLDEVSYEVVSGIEFDIHLFFGSIVLHTPVRNYHFKFVNLRCAENFARHIERHRLEREHQEEETVVEFMPSRPILKKPVKVHEFEDMAGYSWLPNDEDERCRVQQEII
jgi:hypothetical protein